MTEDGVIYLSDREAAELLDRVARKEMGISGDEFLRRWNAGEYDGVDWDDIPGLVWVAPMAPFAR